MKDCNRKIIGFISGVFDGCHIGHQYILTQARSYCNYLYVSINTDDYIFRTKNRRPLNNCFKRRFDLLKLKHISGEPLINYVEIRQEDSPLKTILELRPDLIICGSDYKPEEVIGYKESLEWGGRVIIIERLPNISTTKIIFDKFGVT